MVASQALQLTSLSQGPDAPMLLLERVAANQPAWQSFAWRRDSPPQAGPAPPPT